MIRQFTYTPVWFFLSIWRIAVGIYHLKYGVQSPDIIARVEWYEFDPTNFVSVNYLEPRRGRSSVLTFMYLYLLQSYNHKCLRNDVI